jgi:hypothetical protein
VLVEVLDEATPQRDTFTQLASAYKAINAPVGELGRKTLELSTRAGTGSPPLPLCGAQPHACIRSPAPLVEGMRHRDCR